MPLPRHLAPVLILATLLWSAATGPSASAADVDQVGAWPLRPRPEVTHAFDPPAVAWTSGHRGVDLLGAPRQAVRAALAGTVTFAGSIAGRGVVVVDHGDTRTTYEPVVASVHVGEVVARGATIGRLTFVGSHCLPRACLHWGWLRGETYLDPLDLVGAGPVRLLPFWDAEPRVLDLLAWAQPWRLLPYAALVRQLGRLARAPPR